MAYNKRGFTVVELMIAVAVFSVAIVFVLAGVIYIARKYQQSSVRISLEDSARNIHQQVIQASQFSQTSVKSAVARDASSGNLTARCIGRDMYIFDKRASNVSSINTTAYDSLQSGLWLKRDATGGCAQDDVKLDGAVNLLPDYTKTIVFDYTNSKLTTLFVRAPDNTYLKLGATSSDTKCDYSKAGREFCADVILTSYSVGRID